MNVISQTRAAASVCPPAPASRIAALDGLRGMAVLMVLVFHYKQGMLLLPDSWLTKPLRLLDATQTGVDLFFVLSGFLISGILLDAKGTPHFLRNFYTRRALRILPLYYLVVLGCLAAGWIWGNPAYSLEKVWWYLVYLQNVGMTFWPTAVGEPGHFWSLGVEEHFYLIWPFLMLVCSEKRLPIVLLTLIAGGIACRLLLVSLGYDVFTFSLCRMDALAMGALLAVLLRRPGMASVACRVCRWALIVGGPLLLVLYGLCSGKAQAAVQVVKYALVALTYTVLLGAVVGPGRIECLERVCTRWPLRWCGKFSYAMYVFHPFLYGGIMTYLRRHSALTSTNPLLFMAGEFALCVACTLAVSWLSWQLLEKRFLKLKSLFEYRAQV